MRRRPYLPPSFRSLRAACFYPKYVVAVCPAARNIGEQRLFRFDAALDLHLASRKDTPTVVRDSPPPDADATTPLIGIDANRDALGPAVGAEVDPIDETATEDAKEEIYEVDPSTDSGAPLFPSSTNVRDSLSLLLNDVDSATRLRLAGYSSRDYTDGVDEEEAALQEREADLELAAKVGKALVQKNEALQNELAMSSSRQAEMEDSMKQLAHELAQKESLLREMTKEWREQEFSLLYPRSYDSDCDSEVGRYMTGSKSPSICSEDLQEECRHLKATNSELLDEGHRLRLETVQMEKQEAELVSQCLQKLTEADERIARLIEDSDQKAEEVAKHDNEAKRLKHTLEELEEKGNEFVRSDTELKEQLTLASQRERELQMQVNELQNKYEECHKMLRTAQEEVQFWREKNIAGSPTAFPRKGTLQDELEEAIEKELFDPPPADDVPSTSTPRKSKIAPVRTHEVLETVRAASQQRRNSAPLASRPPLDFSLDSGLADNVPDPDDTLPLSATADEETTLVPGSKVAKNSETERVNVQWHTVDRVHVFAAPEKLQIVKPLEGSRTLHKWQMLASDRGSVRLEDTKLTEKSSGIKVKQREAAGVPSPLPTRKENRKKGLSGLVHRSSAPVNRSESEQGTVAATKTAVVPPPKRGGGLESFAYLNSVLGRTPVVGGGLISRKQSVQIARLLSGVKVQHPTSTSAGTPLQTIRTDSDESLE